MSGSSGMSVAMKRLTRRIGAETIGRLPNRARGGRSIVLCYHSIHPTAPYTTVTPRRFRQDLEWLGEHAELVTLRELMSFAYRETDAPRPRVAITFDDGYEDNLTDAVPILLELSVPATFFVTVGAVERDPVVLDWLAGLRGLKRADQRFLSWAQLRELAGAGFDVGSHTLSHPNLAALPKQQVRAELSDSKAKLEHNLGRPVSSFAYPFGKPRRHFTAATASLVEGCGYERAVSVCFRGVNSHDSPYAIPRFFAPDRTSTLAAMLDGRWDWIGRAQEYLPMPVARLLSPVDFRHDRIGRARLGRLPRSP